MTLDAAAIGRVLNVAISVAVCSAIPLVSSCSLNVLPPQTSDISKRPSHFTGPPRAFLDPTEFQRDQIAFDDHRRPGGVERFILRLAKQVTDALFHEHWVSQAATPRARTPDSADKREASLDGDRANSQTVEVARSAVARRRASRPNRLLTSKTPVAPPTTRKGGVKVSYDKLQKRGVEIRIAQAIQKGSIEEIYFQPRPIAQVTHLRKGDRHWRHRTDVDTNLALNRPHTTVSVAPGRRTVQRPARITDSGLTPTGAISVRRGRSTRLSSNVSRKPEGVSRKELTNVATASRGERPNSEKGTKERGQARPGGDTTKKAQPARQTTRTGRFVVQIASLPTQSAALEYWKVQQPKIRSIIGNTNYQIRQIRLAGDRIFHRVQVGPYTRSVSAWDACKMLRAAGRSCFVVPMVVEK